MADDTDAPQDGEDQPDAETSAEDAPTGADGEPDAVDAADAADDPAVPWEADELAAAALQASAREAFDIAAAARLPIESPGRRTANDANMTVIGELVVYYDTTTVRIPMDGDAALRTLEAWHQDVSWGGDLLDAETASARNSWAVVQLGTRPLAMMWAPRVGARQRPERFAVDPTTG